MNVLRYFDMEEDCAKKCTSYNNLNVYHNTIVFNSRNKKIKKQKENCAKSLANVLLDNIIQDIIY